MQQRSFQSLNRSDFHWHPRIFHTCSDIALVCSDHWRVRPGLNFAGFGLTLYMSFLAKESLYLCQFNSWPSTATGTYSLTGDGGNEQSLPWTSSGNIWMGIFAFCNTFELSLFLRGKSLITDLLFFYLNLIIKKKKECHSKLTAYASSVLQPVCNRHQEAKLATRTSWLTVSKTVYKVAWTPTYTLWKEVWTPLPLWLYCCSLPG